MNTQIFNYNNSAVTFNNNDGQIMVNATEMAKSFDKRPVDWLQNSQTQEYIIELSKVRKSTLADLVQVTKGGNNPGTWMHEDVALEFARWLSPAFAIWCNDRLKELLTKGSVSMAQFHIPGTFSEALMLAAKQAEQLENQQKQLDEQAPKVLFAQAVETSQKSCLVGELAKILNQNGVNIGQKRLFIWLRENAYLCSKGEAYNQPTQKAMDMKLFELKKTTINKPDGSILVSTTVKVTGKGQIYFTNKFLNTMALAN